MQSGGSDLELLGKAANNMLIDRGAAQHLSFKKSFKKYLNSIGNSVHVAEQTVLNLSKLSSKSLGVLHEVLDRSIVENRLAEDSLNLKEYGNLYKKYMYFYQKIKHLKNIVNAPKAYSFREY